MEIIQMENENTSVMNETIETSLQENEREITPEEFEELRKNIYCREILSCGINKDDKILHLGSGYKDSMLFNYFSNLKEKNIVDFSEMRYHAVDVDIDNVSRIRELNDKIKVVNEFDAVEKTIQEFLDENYYTYDWTVITGIFDKNLYGQEKQFEFVDAILVKCLSISKEGVVFTFDTSKKENEEYDVKHIISYIESMYARYSIIRVNEQNYIFCVNKYFLSINNNQSTN